MNEQKLPYPIKITVQNQGKTEHEVTFDKYPVTIGRSKNCDIPLSQYDFLSRQHCVVNIDEGQILVTDLDSANGIFFQGKKIKKAKIEKDLTISIGSIEIRFELLNATITSKKNIEPQEEITKTSGGPKLLPTEIPSFENEQKKTLPKQQVSLQNSINQNEFSVEETQKKTVKTSPSNLDLESPSKPILKLNTMQTSTMSFKGVIKPHHHAAQLRPNQRVLESYVTWKDQIYESQIFYSGDHIIVGQGEDVNLEIPTLKYALPLAFYDSGSTQCVIPNDLKFSIQNETGFIEKEDLIKRGNVVSKNNSSSFKMSAGDVVSIELGPNMAVHFRYGPTPRLLSKDLQILNDPELKKTTLISGLAHFALLLTILLTEPKSKAPVIKNVPERYARLLVKKSEPPKPLPPPEKKMEPLKKKDIAKKEQPKKKPQVQAKKNIKKQPKQTKIVKVQPSKILKKINKYPVEVDRPMKPAEKPIVTNIQSVGALAALNAFSSKVPSSSQPVAININKNAGGQTALNTGGVIGTLKTNTGKLAAGGFASVKTKGLGYGTGTGYGVQGIKGTAGGRAVGGTVVGAPSLVSLSKEDGLTRQQVMDVVRRYMGEIQQCYERSLIDNPNLSGRIEYEWEISAKGLVQWSKVKKSEISGADGLNNCVSGVFKKMKFPVAKNGQNTIPNIGFPFGRL